MPETVIDAAWPVPLPGEEIMSRDEAARSRRPGLRDAKCYLYEPKIAQFWKPNSNGYTLHRAEAGVYEVSYVIGLGSYSGYICYLIPTRKSQSPSEPDDGNPKRKCTYIQYVDAQLNAMLMAAPKNETFRARLMAKMGEMPPAEADTWDKLVDWIEFNFPKEGKVPPKHEPIRMVVSVSEVERGTCRYSLTRSGRGTVAIDAQKIIELAEGTDCDLDELLDNMYDLIREQAENIDTETHDEATDRHEPNDSDGMELNYSFPDFRNKVIALLKASLDTHKLDDLGIE